MGIRIQPREIVIPNDDPFKNDLLSRRDPAEVLTHIVGSIEGPCVLALDAAWGAGKTTFLKLWAQRLRNSKFPVVEFNAWETDHSADPFTALSSELMKGLEGYQEGCPGKAIREATVKVLQHAVPGIVRLVTLGVLDLNPLMEKEVGKILASYASDRLACYNAAQESINDFKNALEGVVENLSRTDGDRPLIVMIDELDRCRPIYAVELLEVAKHLFSVPGVIFVLAINRSELAHSIRSLYGDEFNAEGYLHRFFDVDFQLPDPDRKAFISAMLDSMQLDEPNGRQLLISFFGASDVSLREIAQAIHRLGLVFASLHGDQQRFFTAATVVLILRTLDPNLYHRFIRGDASDLDVAESIYKRVGRRNLRPDERVIFDSFIILGAWEKAAGNQLESSLVTPLKDKYLKIKDRIKKDTGRSEDLPHNPDFVHASRVIDDVDNFQRSSLSVGFTYSVQRIELLSKGH